LEKFYLKEKIWYLSLLEIPFIYSVDLRTSKATGTLYWTL